mgnify:CR=1 FL=1
MVKTRRLGDPQGLPALLAHCFLGHGGTWGRMLAAMGVPLDALAFDMPGHGQSPMPADPGDFHALVAGVVGDLVRRPSLMIGHSFGGASVLRHALHHPETVTGMVLIEPVAFCVARDEPEFAAYAPVEFALHRVIEQGGLVEAARQFLALNPGSPEFDSLPPAAQAQMAQQMRLALATVQGLFGDSGGMARPGGLESFTAPVLLMLGSETTPIFRATVRALAARLPHAEVVVIEGAGHMLPISHPEETGRHLRDWRERTGQGTEAGIGAP